VLSSKGTFLILNFNFSTLHLPPISYTSDCEYQKHTDVAINARIGQYARPVKQGFPDT
jgi:hypothetical protein